jgi:tetratricopeptide (TPR) repeat protein
LSDDDAFRLWTSLNVKGSRAELVPLFRRVEGHPLLLQALASEIANYLKAPGDFAQWRADHPHFDPISLPLVQSRTHILEFALEGLSPKIRQVLHTLVGFRMPASYATLEALLVGQNKACGSAQELDRALTELEDRGLIGWDRGANRYDAHPIVRGVVWQLTDAKDQYAVYSALEAHFEPMGVPEWRQVETLADLTPAIERYHTLMGLERYDDGFEIFRDQLDRATLYRLAAHKERISWLERMFTGGIAGLPALMDQDNQARALHSLGQSYARSGEPTRATSLYRRGIRIDERIGNAQAQRVGFADLGIALSEIGALYAAIDASQRALAIARHLEDAHQEGTTLHSLGRMHGSRGPGVCAHLALFRSRRIFIEQGDRQREGMASAYLAELSLLSGGLSQAFIWGERAWELAAALRFERDFIRAALLQGRIALGSGDLLRADERLHYALTRTRTVNVVEFELPALIAVAQLELLRMEVQKARANIEDVWEAAKRGPYPLQQADAFNVLAAIELAEGNRAAAIDAAINAYKAAWCDGPPFAYHWGLEKAKAQLAALRAPEPEMPPFDESKFEPMPKVEINPGDKFWVDPDKLDQLPD